MNPATESTHQPSGEPTAACGECSAPMAGDQRFCLECGAPADTGATLSFAPIAGATAVPPAGTPASPPAHLLADRPSGGQDGSRHNSAPTVIAAAGVLLLAMGVGVLIGRTGASSTPSTPSTPQVITVSGPTTSTTSTESSESTSSAQAKSSGKHKKGSESGNGVGSSIEHPAPPSVLNDLKKSGGGSYEQKSKNLPNVISTG